MSARDILIEFLGGKCEVCGSKEDLRLHHKDHNRKNNSIDNIKLLCHTHHQEAHGFMKDGEASRELSEGGRVQLA